MSFDSNGSQSSQSQIISLSDYLSAQDYENFVWDDANREMSDAWLAPVVTISLSLRKHKIFHHSNKEYLKPPSPFVQQGPELGDSGSTIVYKVTSPEGYAYRRPLALKVIICKENSRPPGPDSKVRVEALKEVMTTASLKHPHIVAYVASFEDYCIQTREIRQRPRGKARAVFKVDQQIKRHILGIAMYPPAQCNLHTLMNEVIQHPNEADWMVAYLHTYFGCLAQAVAYLHQQTNQVRHKDIKPENIVIDDFGVPILTDFGLSRHFETGQYSEGPTPKTLKYACPEAMQEKGREQRSDVFSLGCVYLEIATVLLGKPPRFAEEQLSDEGASLSTTDFKYCESLHNLDAYLALLSTRVAPDLVAADPAKEASAKAVLAALPTIRRMMDASDKRRPLASDLYPAFRHLYDVHDSPGPCANCEEERRSGRAIFPPPPRSGSPTLSRSATMGVGAGGGSGGPASIVRRGTGPMATTVLVSSQAGSPVEMEMSDVGEVEESE